MKGVFYILFAYLLGEGLSLLLGRLIPGSVLGMIMLFTALRAGIIKTGDVKEFAQALLDNMLLFFVPISVGLMTAYDTIGADLAVIVLIVVSTTLLVATLVGWMQQKWGRAKNG